MLSLASALRRKIRTSPGLLAMTIAVIYPHRWRLLGALLGFGSAPVPPRPRISFLGERMRGIVKYSFITSIMLTLVFAFRDPRNVPPPTSKRCRSRRGDMLRIARLRLSLSMASSTNRPGRQPHGPSCSSTSRATAGRNQASARG